jgi:transposase
MKFSHYNYTATDDFFESKGFQTTIFVGFDKENISPMCYLINYFIDHSSFDFFPSAIKKVKRKRGNTGYDYNALFKVLLYAIYCRISLSKLKNFLKFGTEFHYLSLGFNALCKRQKDNHFPKERVFGKLFKIVDKNIDTIFDASLDFIQSQGIVIDTSSLFGDGTVTEARNNKFKIASKNNITSTIKKLNALIDDPNRSVNEKTLAKSQKTLEEEKREKLDKLERNSFGLSDEDSEYMLDKRKTTIAGYNVQLVEEANYGLVVFAYTSNLNPDAKAFSQMLDALIEKFHPKSIVFDAGYGTTDIIAKLKKNGVEPIVFALKLSNAKAGNIINEYSFELASDEKTLTCKTGRILILKGFSPDGKRRYRSINCEGCVAMDKCITGAKRKTKTVLIDIEKYKAMISVKNDMMGEERKAFYKKRSHTCETPNSFFKTVLGGDKSQMIGVTRNGTMIKLYMILFNLRRMLTIKNIE